MLYKNFNNPINPVKSLFTVKPTAISIKLSVNFPNMLKFLLLFKYSEALFRRIDYQETKYA